MPRSAFPTRSIETEPREIPIDASRTTFNERLRCQWFLSFNPSLGDSTEVTCVLNGSRQTRPAVVGRRRRSSGRGSAPTKRIALLHAVPAGIGPVPACIAVSGRSGRQAPVATDFARPVRQRSRTGGRTDPTAVSTAPNRTFSCGRLRVAAAVPEPECIRPSVPGGRIAGADPGDPSARAGDRRRCETVPTPIGLSDPSLKTALQAPSNHPLLRDRQPDAMPDTGGS